MSEKQINPVHGAIADDGKVSLVINIAEQSKNKQATLKALATLHTQKGLPVFRRVETSVDGYASIVSVDGKPNNLRTCQYNTTLKIKEFLLDNITYWNEANSRLGVRPTQIPNDLPDSILHTKEEDCPLPILKGIIRRPVIDEDGVIHTDYGYSSASQYFLDWTHGPLEIPELTADNAMDIARSCYDKLSDIFSDTPFETDVDKSMAMAVLMGATYRQDLPTAPLVVINGKAPGTGKTFLGRLISYTATGEWPEVANGKNKDDSELGLEISNVLDRGKTIVFLDNASNGSEISSEMLCRMVTAGTDNLTIRKLHVGYVSYKPTVSVIITGNQIKVVEDLKRRTALINLNARSAKPSERKFRRSAKAMENYIESHRKEIIELLVTIRMAFKVANPEASAGQKFGRPRAGFTEWHEIAVAPLVWAGYADPALNFERMEQDDPDASMEREGIEAYVNYIKGSVHNVDTNTEMTVNALITKLAEGMKGNTKDQAELVVAWILGMFNGQPNAPKAIHDVTAHRLKLVLAKRVFKPVRIDGVDVEFSGKQVYGGKSKLWDVRRCNPAEPMPEVVNKVEEKQVTELEMLKRADAATASRTRVAPENAAAVYQHTSAPDDDDDMDGLDDYDMDVPF
jgi:hypothetical protein